MRCSSPCAKRERSMNSFCAQFCRLLCFWRSKDAGDAAGSPYSETRALEELPINGRACAVGAAAADEMTREAAAAKSSLKKGAERNADDEKRSVTWVDLRGKELVEIKEFEPSECGDSQDDAGSGSICAIQ